MIHLKSEKDLEMLSRAGQILAEIMRKIKEFTKAGISTKQIDSLAEELLQSQKVQPAFKGYKGFPATVCTSVNEEIVHGIPSERKLVEGDIVSLDLGINYEGYFSDTALTFPIGRIDSQKRRLMEVTKKALYIGIEQAIAENHLSDISNSIQTYVENNGFSVVRQFVGHGIGRSLHEEPEIPNFGARGLGPVLKAGMVLAIEPMVNVGTWECEIMENGWTAVTKDRLPSAHFEHTIAITKNGPQILTH